MKDNIEVSYYDVFSGHTEQALHNVMEDGTVPGAYVWPKPTITLDNWVEKQVLVARVDGVVAGRAVLSSGYYPLAELENLVVDPSFRGQGIGSRMVEFAVRQAAAEGYLGIHLQTEPDNVNAQRLYVRNGFVPAIQGQFLKMMRFLFYPALSRFRRDHPLALLQSQPGTRSAWELRWQDPVSRDSIGILLSGGSSQADSGGRGPGLAGFDVNDRGTAYSAEISGPAEARKGSEFEVGVKLRNRGNGQITGACRLLLNAGFEPTSGSDRSRAISIEPGSEQEIVMSLRLMDSFDDDIMKVLTYRSAAVAVEFLIGEQVFSLSHEVIAGEE